MLGRLAELVPVLLTLGAHAVLSVTFGLVLLVMFRSGARGALGFWGLAWTAEGVRLVAGGVGLMLRAIPDATPGVRLAYSMGTVAFGLLQAMLLLEGARAWRVPRTPTLRRVGGLLAVALAGGAALTWAVPEGPQAMAMRLFVRLEVPRLLIAAALWWAAWAVLQTPEPEGRTSMRRRVLAALLVAGGLVKAQYAVVGDLAVASGAGMIYTVLTTVLEIAAMTAIGMALFYLSAADDRRAATARAQAEIEARLDAEARGAALVAAREALYRTVLAGAHDVVILLDMTGTVRYVTPSVTRVAGWDPAELVGQPVAALLDPSAAEQFGERFRRLVAGETDAVEPAEVLARTKEGGWVTLEATMRRETGPDGAPVIVSTSRDLAERKRLEAQLLRAQRMESLGRLAGGVAHDFNNLLGVIFTSTDLAHDVLPREHEASVELREIRLAAERAAALTRQLLAFSRRQVVENRRLVPGELSRSLEPMLRRLLDAAVRLALDVGRSTWAVRMDPTQLEQVVLNLVVNARDALEDGGVIAVSVDDVTMGVADLARNAERHVGDHVRLRVTDTGCGMDDATMSRIFEPFFSTKEPGKGTGLGLAMVYGAVTQAGGWIEVQSSPGAGTTFDVFLPRDTAEEDATEAAPETPLPPEGVTGTVLVVDDQPQVRGLAARALRRRGFRVLEASTGREGLAVAAGYDGEIALVVSDIVMPEMGGPAMVRELKTQRPGLRVLFTSGYAKSAFAENILSQDGAEFIGKPYGVADLAARAQRMVATPVGA
jgi:PAS domain S-box-containing protein